MKIILIFFSVIIAVSCVNNKSSMQSTNKNEADWQVLLDGRSLEGWHTYGKSTTGKAWKVEGGTLRFDATVKKEFSDEGGDLVTIEEYDNFHLELEWKIAPGGNSGIIFFVKEDKEYNNTWETGLEMQILDNERHEDAKYVKHRAGDLYDLVASKEVVKQANEWNKAEIISNDGKLEFFLNNQKVLQTTLWNDRWSELVAGSKFKNMPGFGKYKSGKIALQDHGDNVWFRNIRIKRL